MPEVTIHDSFGKIRQVDVPVPLCEFLILSRFMITGISRGWMGRRRDIAGNWINDFYRQDPDDPYLYHFTVTERTEECDGRLKLPNVPGVSHHEPMTRRVGPTRTRWWKLEDQA